MMTLREFQDAQKKGATTMATATPSLSLDWRKDPHVREAQQALAGAQARVEELQADLAMAQADRRRLAEAGVSAGSIRLTQADARLASLAADLGRARAQLHTRPSGHGLVGVGRDAVSVPDSSRRDPLGLRRDAQRPSGITSVRGMRCQCGEVFDSMAAYEQHIRELPVDTGSARARLAAAEATAKIRAEDQLRQRYQPLVRDLAEHLDAAAKASAQLASLERQADKADLPHPTLSLTRQGRETVLDEQDEVSVLNRWRRDARRAGLL